MSKQQEQFERWRTIMRKWFALSQQGALPQGMPRLDGLDYKRIDDVLIRELYKLEHSFPRVEWIPLYQADAPSPQWYKVTKEIALEMQDQGMAMVRVSREEYVLPDGKLLCPPDAMWEVYF